MSFFQDLHIDGLVVQAGPLDRVDLQLTPEAVGGYLKANQNRDLYFVGGVDPATEGRAKDADIRRKNYVFLDFDVRESWKKEQKEISDEEIKELAHWLGDCLNSQDLLREWRYIVFTGNGLHVYYFGKPVPITDRQMWTEGVRELTAVAKKATGMDPDKACVNPARLARIPGSCNNKHGRKVETCIVREQAPAGDILPSIEELGRRRVQTIVKDISVQNASLKIMADGSESTYGAIQSVPVGNLVAQTFGWEFDGRNFFTPGSQKPKGCFVPEGENFVVHGGTDHFADTHAGYSPFTFVKTVHRLTNELTFGWFKERFPEIAVVSRREWAKKQEQAKQAEVGRAGIDEIFTELAHVKFDVLKLGADLDEHKLLIRGAVTRVGAFSNIGKSKFAYFLTYQLLQHGYRGAIFSTEVQRPIVLANLVQLHAGVEFWDVIKHRYQPDDRCRAYFKNLMIFDVRQTKNQLEKIESCMTGLDFVVIDFVQGVQPKQKADRPYERLTNYALEIQAIAQEKNCAVLDLSQIGNEALSDANSEYGFIGFKNSGDLYSSADIAVLLKRQKTDKERSRFMTVHVRKHKYMPQQDLQMECDFRLGQFKKVPFMSIDGF